MKTTLGEHRQEKQGCIYKGVQNQPNRSLQWVWGSDCKGHRGVSGVVIKLSSGSEHRGVAAFIKFIKLHRTMQIHQSLVFKIALSQKPNWHLVPLQPSAPHGEAVLQVDGGCRGAPQQARVLGLHLVLVTPTRVPTALRAAAGPTDVTQLPWAEQGTWWDGTQGLCSFLHMQHQCTAWP